MKAKIIAVMVALSCYCCAASYGQNMGGIKGGNNTPPPTPPANNSNVNKPAPTPSATPNIFGNTTLNTLYAEVVKTKEYQNIKKQVQTKVNNSKAVKRARNWQSFLYRIGLMKRPVVKKAQ